MFCRQCGARLPDDSLFCNVCGARVAPPETGVPQPQAPPRPAGAFDPTQLLRTTGTGPNDPSVITGSSPQYPATSSSQYPGYPTPQSAPISSPHYPSAPFMPTSSSSYPSYPNVSSGSNPQYSPYPEAYAHGDFPYSSYPPTGQASTIATPQGPALVLPQSPLQRWLVQIFGSTLATNPFFGVILASIIAVAASVLACGVFLAIAHAIAPHVGGGSYSQSGEDLIDYAIGITPLHDLFRDSLQLFIVIQGPGTHYLYTSGNSFTSTYYIAPFSALLIIPALFLVMGGYIAASTDFQRNVRSSLWRGALLAIPYAILLFLSSLAVNGCVPTPGSNGTEVCSAVATSTASVYTMSIDTTMLLFFGVLWGALFGLLGATLKLSQGHWRQSLFRLLRTTNRPQVAGMLVGGLASAGLAIALAIATVFSFVAYSSYSVPLLSETTCIASQYWQSVILWGISQGPLYAINLLLFALGAPITVSNPQANPCFYIRGMHESFSLFGTTPPLSPWLHLLLAIPILSLFLGGRASAAWGRARGPAAGALQGALAAAPFAAVMLLLVPLSSITGTVTSSGGTNGSQTVTQSVSAGAFEVILWTLLGGAVIASLGGLYQVSPLQPAVSKLFRALALPFRAIAAPLYQLLDRISRLPHGTQRSSTRNVIYAALLWMILLAIIAAVGGGVLVGFNQTITYAVNLRVRDILSVILVAAPCLLIIVACATALSRDHGGAAQAAPAAPNPVTPPVPSYYGPSMPGGRP